MNISFNSNMLNNRLVTQRQKTRIGTLLTLLLVGAVFLFGGYIAINSQKIDTSWTRSSGEVISSKSSISDGKTLYTPVIGYRVNGQSYTITGTFSSSVMPSIGESREIAYDPAQPEQAKVVENIGSSWWLWLFPVAGISLLIIGPLSFIKSLKRSKNITNLIQSGQKIQGVLTNIQSLGNRNNNSYIVTVSAADKSGAVQNYTSDTLTGIAGLAMADFRNNPIPIDVYIDSANSQNYYVDISDIPNLTPQRINELIQSATQNAQPQPVAPGGLVQPNSQPSDNTNKPSAS